MRTDAGRRLRRAPAVASMLLAMAVLAGCAGTSEAGRPPPATAPVVLPDGSAVSADQPIDGPADSTCLGSDRPTGPLPAPGDPAAGPTVTGIRNRPQADRALKVGVDQTTADWGYLDPQTGTLQGFDVDMLTKVAAAIFGGDPVRDRTIRFVVVPNDQRQQAVDSGQVDLLAETMSITCARRIGDNAVDFSSVYFETGQGILAPKTTSITSPDDLKGKRVCATNGSTSVRQLATIDGVIPWGAATQTDCLLMLQQGNVDAISTDLTILAGLAGQDDTLEVKTDAGGVPITLRPEWYGMAIAPGHTDFVRFVNAVLEKDRADPDGWAGTYRRWICHDDPACTVPQPTDPTYRD